MNDKLMNLIKSKHFPLLGPFFLSIYFNSVSVLGIFYHDTTIQEALADGLLISAALFAMSLGLVAAGQMPNKWIKQIKLISALILLSSFLIPFVAGNFSITIIILKIIFVWVTFGALYGLFRYLGGPKVASK